MRTYTIYIFVFFAIILCVLPSYGIDKDSILGIWLFDENKDNIIEDSSANNRKGELKGNVKWAKGKFGTALELPGQGDSYAIIPHDDALSVKSFSVTAWVNLVNRGAYQALVEKSEVQGDVRNFYLAVTPEGLLYGGFKGDNGWNSVLADTVTDEKWHHSAVTYDMKKIIVYLDGKPFTKLAIGVEGGIDPLQNKGPIVIGVTNTSGTEPTQGLIDEVGVFNKGLSETEIKSIMDKGLKQSALLVAKNSLAITWGKAKLQ